MFCADEEKLRPIFIKDGVDSDSYIWYSLYVSVSLRPYCAINPKNNFAEELISTSSATYLVNIKNIVFTSLIQ